MKRKEEVNKQEEKIEYIKVEGYKGLNHNLCGYGDFQFEIGKTYSIDSDPILCKKGFHFCLKLGDVFSYYPLDENNRFFKVEALVSKKDAEKYYSNYPPHPWGLIYQAGTALNKLAAKEITLLEEVSPEELFKYYSFKDPYYFTIDDFKYMREHQCSQTTVIHQKFINILKDKYSDIFIELLYNKCKDDATAIEVLKKAIMLHEIGASPDVKAYLLVQ